MKTKKELSQLSIVALRNLFFEETRAFLLALDTETAEGLQERRERIRSIDKAIEEKRTAPKQITLFKEERL